VDKPDQQRDFFVSYTQADRAWAEWLAWELEAAGYTTLLQAWDMPPGTAFVHAMDQAVQRTRHTLLVLSPAYLRSAMTEAEWRPGFVADPSGQDRRLVPVRVEPCAPEGLLADRVYLDVVGLDEATARTRLREGIAAALRGHGRPASPPRFPRASVQAAVDRPRFPTALPPVWNVPFQRNPTFTGRQQELAMLAGTLEPGGTAAVTQVLQGAGGVGKTTLAVEYAYRHRSGFDAVWWVRAEQPATLLGDLAELGAALGLAEAGQPDQQLTVAAVRRWLADHDRWLLVLDNAGAPEGPSGLRVPLGRLVDLLPQVVHGQVLVTSRDTRWEHHATLAELQVFTPQEAVAFLLARSGSNDQATAAKVAQLLGFLPLALEQAGAYVRETQISLGAYQARLQRSPLAVLRRGTPRDRNPADTVATTWQLSVEQVSAVPGATALLELCAFLAPDDIPRTLLERLSGLAELPAGLAVLADAMALDEAIGGLRRFGLLKASPEVVAVHRLVQQVIRDRLDPEGRHRLVAVALRLLQAAFPNAHDDPDAWPAYAELLPHALAVTGHAQELDLEPESTADLLTQAGMYLWQRADYRQARTLLERALGIREKRLGPNHPLTADSLSNLANVVYDQRDLEGARPLYERALTIYEADLGPHHPRTATTLSNLANVLRAQGDLDAARPLQQRALHIRETRLGGDHPHTARSLHDLAEVLYDQGDLAGARPLFERALAIRETRQGADHPDTAHSLSNLANVLADQGDLERARTLHERVLAIREARLGGDHPHTARSLNALAEVLHAQGNLDAARRLHERGLRIREARLGGDHPHTARSLNDLARVLHAQGNLELARRLHERARAIYQTRLGADHPDTADSLSYLAVVLHAQGDLARARTLHERALAIYEARLGPNHPRTAWSLSNLAGALYEQGDPDGARTLHERALAIRETHLGPEHPLTVRSRENLAAVAVELENPQ
jgi:tetratricopeptide (TPR) repeat protein